jgi:polysaccharide export outer membrane protein
MKKSFFLVFIVFIGCVCILPDFSLQAQESGRSSQLRNRASQYYLGMEDELLIPVYVWGFVKIPGQYMVPNNTDLISLLSFAGGPSDGAKISNVQIVRSDPKLGSSVIKVDVKKYLNTADDRLIPTLKPEDTVIVKGSTFNWISKFLGFISSLTFLVNIYYLVSLAEAYRNR